MTNTSFDEAIVVTDRAGWFENSHRGRICVVSADEPVIVESCGDMEAPAFVRSTAKPLQAIASVLGGVAEHYGLEERHLAMMAASQRGYPQQMAALEEMLARTGVPEEALVFHAGKPVASQPRDEWARNGGQMRKLYHTCAGKHLGMLAWSNMQGWPLQGYAEPEHPAQREILRRVCEWSGATEPEVRVGRDGCGLPVAAMPMKRIAAAYARLSNPETAPDSHAAAAAARLAAAMNRYPELVEGPGRLASILLSDPNVVAKSGAQGLFAIGLRRQRLGIAVHVTDGTEIAWPYIVMALLERYGGISEETRARLEARFPAKYRNDAGEVAGQIHAVLPFA